MNKSTLAEIETWLSLNFAGFVSDALIYGSKDKETGEEFGLSLTVASDGKLWNYQTGDNSFTGGAYGLPHWAVVEIFPHSDAQTVFKDISSQLEELTAQ